MYFIIDPGFLYYLITVMINFLEILLGKQVMQVLFREPYWKSVIDGFYRIWGWALNKRLYNTFLQLVFFTE